MYSSDLNKIRVNCEMKFAYFSFAKKTKTRILTAQLTKNSADFLMSNMLNKALSAGWNTETFAPN
jgi:hypothetical protein